MKKFTKINDPFTCENCGKEVLPTDSGTYRDHCPFCLYSKHVDVNPGDRANSCKGLLKPIDLDKGKKGTLVIIYKCLRCSAEVRNKMAQKTTIQPDDYDLALKISSSEKPWPNE
jgi:DNA-directed RNA polymerase subunit RPC12/RpoP